MAYLASAVSLAGYQPVDVNNSNSDKDDIIKLGISKKYPTHEDTLEGVGRHKTDGSWTAKKASVYVRRIIHAINKELIRQGGVKLRYRDLDIGEMEDSEIELMDSKGHLQGYVLGYYDTRTKKLRLNPYLTEEQLKTVTFHEMLHYTQDKLGIIGKYVERYGPLSRSVIESEVDLALHRLLPELSDGTEPLPDCYKKLTWAEA